MHFSNNLFLLLLLFAPTFQSVEGAPSHDGEQLAAEEDEEINDSEDFVEVFKEDQLETEQELDTAKLGASDEQTVGGTDLRNVTEDVSTTTNPSGLSDEQTVSGTEDVGATTDGSPSISPDQLAGEETDIPTTIVGQELTTEDTDAEATDAKGSSMASTVSNEDVSEEDDEVQGGTTGLLTTSSETEADIETTLNGVTEGSSKGNDPMEPEGTKAPESDVTESSIATEPSENDFSAKSETTAPTTSTFDENASIIDDQPSDNNSQSDDDNSDTDNDDSEHNDSGSELNESTNTEDYMQAIDQFQKQNFSKEGTTLSQEESVSWESTTLVEGSLYLESSSNESSGADSGMQVEEQDQAEDQEKDGEIEESRSLLSRWWLWLIMLCLGLGLGLLCKSRMNASQGEAEYLRMGERHQGSTITIPR